MSLIDVFFCSAADPDDGIRCGFSQACLARWTKEAGINLRLLAAQSTLLSFSGAATTMPLDSFQRNRRIYADNRAESGVYIVADDDCLLQPEPVVEPALKLMADYPEFGALSLWPNNSLIYPWTPDSDPELVGGKVSSDDTVLEHVSVGGVRFCRKGLIKKWPEQNPETPKAFDREHGIAMREAGYRVGYFRELFMNHLGRGFSTVWT